MRRQVFAVMTSLIAITPHAAYSPLAGTWRLTGYLRTAQPGRPHARG